MQLSKQLDLIIQEHHLLNHPFYQAWNKGMLSREVLQTYAAQYYAQVDSFPRFVSRVHTHCPVIEARKVLLENLVDEEIQGTDHPALWMQFAEGLGVSKTRVKNEVLFPETQALVNTFYDIAERDWLDGLCALYVYESQVPAISKSKIAGLKDFYGIKEEHALAFFTAHEAYDVEHAYQVATLINQYADPTKAAKTTKEAATVLWGFLDGICREGEIACN